MPFPLPLSFGTGLALAAILVTASGCTDAPAAPEAPTVTGVTGVPEGSGSPPAAAPPRAATTHTATRKPPPAAHLPAPASGEGLARFVAAVQDRLPGVAVDRRDEEVAELGRQTCASLAAGRKPASVVREIRTWGVADADAGTLVTLARETACRN